MSPITPMLQGNTLQGQGSPATTAAISEQKITQSEKIASSCLLKRQVSDETGDVQGKWAEVLAVSSEAAFKGEMLTGGTSKTVIFQLRSFTQNIEQQVQDAKASASGQETQFQPWVRGFLRYVTDGLLARPCFKVLPEFAVFFRRVEAVAPKQVPPLTTALCSLSEVDDVKADFDTNCLSKWPNKKNELEQSALYKDYEGARSLARKELARSAAATMSPSDRYKLVQSLLSPGVEDPELSFACTMLAGTMAANKLSYLLGDAKRFVLLQAWFPGHGMHLFEPLSREGGALNDMSCACFQKAAAMLLLVGRR
jgi:hypothetical protein